MPLDGTNLGKINPVLDTLIKADAYLTPETWAKYATGWCGEHHVCSMGAIAKVTGGRGNPHYDKAMSFLFSAVPEGWASPDVFNDHPDTTFEQVKAVFARAIELASGEGAGDGQRSPIPSTAEERAHEKRSSGHINGRPGRSGVPAHAEGALS